MRPPGEVRQALLDAARALTTETTAPTLVELAARSQVGREAARRTIDNLCRAQLLVVVRTRKVDYRNRPVAEYCTPDAVASAPSAVRCDFRSLVSTWSLQAA